MSTQNNEEERRELPSLSGDMMQDINRARGKVFLADVDNEPFF